MGSPGLISKALSLSAQFGTLYTERFFLRPITTNDANANYLSWLNNPLDSEFIYSANTKMSLQALTEYIKDRLKENNVLFLGIFEKNSGLHLGNIKYEPIDFIESYAVMGILIGEKNWRGQGVAIEILHATGKWLNRNFGIAQIILGVNRRNFSAIAAYKKIGFFEKSNILTPQLNKSEISMTWVLNE